MAISKLKKPPRARGAKTGSRAKPQVSTIRLEAGVQKGLRILKAHSRNKLSLNKLVNLALAQLIEKQAATIESELDEALRNIKAYRKTDPGYKRAIRAFIDAEVAFAAEDPMEGSREPQATGPAVSAVRKILRG